MTEYQLKIQGVMENVPQACGWVVEIAEQAGLNMRDVNHCELAVDEAVTNIIEHGYGQEGASKSIEILVKSQTDYFSITIVDDGPAFDPLGMEEPDPLSALEDRPANGGGWGVFFIKKLMDDVDYEYRANRNHLKMVKRLAS